MNKPSSTIQAAALYAAGTTIVFEILRMFGIDANTALQGAVTVVAVAVGGYLKKETVLL